MLHFCTVGPRISEESQSTKSLEDDGPVPSKTSDTSQSVPQLHTQQYCCDNLKSLTCLSVCLYKKLTAHYHTGCWSETQKVTQFEREVSGEEYCTGVPTQNCWYALLRRLCVATLRKRSIERNKFQNKPLFIRLFNHLFIYLFIY